jgi:maltooligosyltrehalose trehalohydrolase
MTNADEAFRPLLGATPVEGATIFRVRAPGVSRLDLVLRGSVPDGADRIERMQPDADGLFTLTVGGAGNGTRYAYLVDGRGPFPDPASRWQPDGVHGFSAVVDWKQFEWTDETWRGIPLERTVLYEVHVGTFTPEGTFAAAADRLSYLADLGVTAVELMPVADFPGRRNWGYDGAAPFAPSRNYGTPDDMRRFVDRAHALGLAVHLDVVYNHLGPDGSYQATFNRDFYSTTHQNPWGAGINFDGPGGVFVREYFIESALRWVHEYHIDGLRLDATHAIADDSPVHVVAELADRVRASASGAPSAGPPRRHVLVIAEDERNLDTIVRPREVGGWGLDGIWADDLHHHLRVALAGDRDGYFADYDGSMQAIAATARQGWFYTGQVSAHRGHRRGTDPSGIPLARSIVCLQNHDQVGNRAFGDRLHHTIDIASWMAASTFLLALPETPLLFMGQEWAASSPFQYFTDHYDELGRLVTEGRRREFGRFAAFADPASHHAIPDPQAASTFEASRLDWSEHAREPHASVLALYRRLLALRRTEPAMTDADRFVVEAAGTDGLVVRRGDGEGTLLFIVRLRGAGTFDIAADIARAPHGCTWQIVLSTHATGTCNPGGSAPGTNTGAEAPALQLSDTNAGAEARAVRLSRPGAVVLKAVTLETVAGEVE